MNKDLLKSIIVDQQELVLRRQTRDTIISRNGIEKTGSFLKSPNVLLISGMRRCGKSTFAHQVAAGQACATINFDDERLFEFKTSHFNLLLEAFLDIYGEFGYLLFDEIQNIPGWELFINRIRSDYKIIITGSNAHLLSSELATHLTGRYDAMTLYPMSWKEYCVFSGIDLDPTKTLSTRQKSRQTSVSNQYVATGGLFEYYSLGKEHIRSLFGAIINKDIFGRYAVSYQHILQELALLMVNSFASKISMRQLSAHFQVKSPHTIKEYLGYLQNTYLIFAIEKWSYKLREQQTAAKKIYVVDNGIIDALSFSFSANSGRLLENSVAIELKRRATQDGSEVFYWDDYTNECDFIIKSGRRVTAALQVCYELTDATKPRELAGLMKAMTEFKLPEGFIITMNRKDEEKIAGKWVRTIPFYVWAAIG
jgi:predicted AAA+ superfamily ATPase